MYDRARFSTAPDMIKFACKHGIKQNPMFMKCDSCPNQSSCEIFFSNNPAPKLSDRERQMIKNDLTAARNKKKSSTKEILHNFFITVLIFFVLWLISFFLP